MYGFGITGAIVNHWWKGKQRSQLTSMRRQVDVSFAVLEHSKPDRERRDEGHRDEVGVCHDALERARVWARVPADAFEVVERVEVVEEEQEEHAGDDGPDEVRRGRGVGHRGGGASAYSGADADSGPGIGESHCIYSRRWEWRGMWSLMEVMGRVWRAHVASLTSHPQGGAAVWLGGGYMDHPSSVRVTAKVSASCCRGGSLHTG